ncbi:PilN domain-containing protein [Spirulina major CS-329]|uniref:PilN domain-containing protein n=1 Tax=Spirulina TaxID=1154 RepID=UPI00232AB9A3|nr:MULTISPECIES: PilN domain-containing protein [Spirulina]MDB9493741.1 PilN domain-containing protein [Spirulina subsalsa CS-330]MDB9501959.1 PilN domain-containing protein [Spirulina major CS-329]
MYSLDVNFLDDRVIVSGASAAAQAKKPAHKYSAQELMPIFIGGGVAVLLLAAAGGGYGFLYWQTQQANNELNVINSQIQALQAQNQRIQELESDINVAQQQTNGLAQVFARILPWSAVIEDLRARIPSGLQIRSFSVLDSAEGGAPPPTQSATPVADAAAADLADPAAAIAPALPMPMVALEGYADSYEAVNVFSISLQRSAFFDGPTVQIMSAQLVADPNSVDVAAEGEGGGGGVTIELPQVVQYRIQGQLRDLTTLSSTELIAQLKNKKNLGSVVRLEALQEKGIIQP